jgi:two-component system NtrC family sensor kinase
MVRLLLVDDSATARAIVGDALEMAGFTVLGAGSGAEALELFSRERPDVVVCDLVMPGMDGIALVRVLRAMDPLASIIILTEQGDVDACVRALREGAEGFLGKGMPLEVLEREVYRALERRRLLEHNLLLQEMNQAYQRQLEEMVREKTAEVLRLEQLKSHAEKVGALGTVVAGVAHEVNNPLAVVKSNLRWVSELSEALCAREGLLTAERLGPELCADLRELPDVLRESSASVDRIANIVSTLRRIAHPATANARGRVTEGLQDAELHCRPLLAEGVELVRELDARLPEVPLSREDLATILSNLIGNAAQAIRNGRGRIAVAARQESGRVRLEVSDTGCGISPENLARVCDPFFTTKPPGRGIGLGLSLVRQLVTAAAGSLSVESTPGQGTTFRLLLPAASPLPAEAR